MTLMGIGIICQDKLQTVEVGGNEEENILTNKLVLRCKLWQSTSLFYDTFIPSVGASSAAAPDK